MHTDKILQSKSCASAQSALKNDRWNRLLSWESIEFERGFLRSLNFNVFEWKNPKRFIIKKAALTSFYPHYVPVFFLYTQLISRILFLCRTESRLALLPVSSVTSFRPSRPHLLRRRFFCLPDILLSEVSTRNQNTPQLQIEIIII